MFIYDRGDTNVRGDWDEHTDELHRIPPLVVVELSVLEKFAGDAKADGGYEQVDHHYRAGDDLVQIVQFSCIHLLLIVDAMN